MPAETQSTPSKLALLPTQIDDLKLASSYMTGAERRAFQAQIVLKYCAGSARQAERVFGWGRETVQLGLHEQRTGITCLGAQAAFCGQPLWEAKHPEVAAILWEIVEAASQQDPSFRTTLRSTRLTAAEALAQLRDQGVEDSPLPSPSTMAQVLNRNGYRLRPVLKAKPQKKSPKPTRSLPISTTRTSRPRPMPASSG